MVRRLALAALVLVAVAIGLLSARQAPHFLRVRELIAEIRSGDPGRVAAGFVAFEGLEAGPALRLQRGALFDAMEAALERFPRPGATGGSAGARAPGATGPVLVAAAALLPVFERLARQDPAAIEASRATSRPRLERVAFRALLRIGRPDLACAAPRDLEVVPWRAEGDSGGRASALFAEGGAGEDLGPRDVFFSADAAGACMAADIDIQGGSFTALADLGDVPLERAEPPPPGDRRWHPRTRWIGSLWPAVPVAPGRTYVFERRQQRPDGDPSYAAAFRVLEVGGGSVRIRWRLFPERPR